MTPDEVQAHIARLENLIAQTRELISNAASSEEAAHELMNLVHFEQTLSVLTSHREYLRTEQERTKE